MRKKIIISEGVQSILDTNTLFKRGNLAVEPAKSCEEIIHLHRSERADLIIAERDLGVMGGVKLCSSIRSDPSLKNVSIIMAVEADDPEAADCKKAGANAVLSQPFDAMALFTTVSQMLMVHQRMAVRVPLRITVEGKTSHSVFVGISKDVSVSGMLVESGRVLQQGDRLDCSFTVNGRVINVGCVVARSHHAPEGGYQYGIKFLNLDARTFVLLEHFIKSSSPAKTQD